MCLPDTKRQKYYFIPYTYQKTFSNQNKLNDDTANSQTPAGREFQKILSTQNNHDLTTKRHFLIFLLICFPNISCPYVNVYTHTHTRGCRDLFQDFTRVHSLKSWGINCHSPMLKLLSKHISILLQSKKIKHQLPMLKRHFKEAKI